MKLSARAITLAAPSAQDFRLLKDIWTEPVNPDNDQGGFAFWRIFGNILIGLASIIAAPLTEGASLGLTTFITFAETAVDVGFNVGLDFAQNGKIDPWNVGLPIAGAAAAIGGAYKGLRQISRLEFGEKNLAERATNYGLDASQSRQVAKQLGEAAGGKSASEIRLVIQRAGLTDKQTAQQLQLVKEELARSGVKANRFFDEVDFINQESDIFNTTWKSFENLGIKLDPILEGLKKGGIDIIGLKTQKDFIQAARRSPQIARVLEGAGVLQTIEKEIGASLEPSFVLQLINARNVEKTLQITNKTLKLINPNRLVKKIVDKVFEPIKHQVDERVWEKFGKKAKQKVKQLLRQHEDDKYKTKNGVYPAFASSWINYLRATGLGNGAFKCSVIFRKRGYAPVAITPTMSLSDIINWSQSTSPGRIYHGFKDQYGGTNGGEASSEFGTDLLRISNLLGFIPSKNISLGTSLIGNAINAYSIIRTHKWSTFWDKQIGDKFKDEVIEATGEVIGGRFGKAVAHQASGDSKAIRNFVVGGAARSLRKRGGENLKRKRKEQASARSLLKIRNLSNKF